MSININLFISSLMVIYSTIIYLTNSLVGHLDWFQVFAVLKGEAVSVPLNVEFIFGSAATQLYVYYDNVL